MCITQTQSQKSRDDTHRKIGTWLQETEIQLHKETKGNPLGDGSEEIHKEASSRGQPAGNGAVPSAEGMSPSRIPN